MVAMTRAPLGLALEGALMPTAQPTVPHGLAQTSAPEKPGFFKEGGMGRIIAGLIGDALLQQGGMRPVYSPMMQQRQALAREEAQWTRRRQAENEDWMARQQWERANPAPRAPYRFQDNAGNLVEIGDDGQPRTVFKDPTPKTTYIQADNGDGTKTIIPVVNGVPQVGGGAQSTPKRNLGPVVDTVPGGGAGNSVGGFRR